MEAIVGMGHFCDTHGPSVILCTHPADGPLLKGAPVATPACDGCRSIDDRTVLVSEGSDRCFVTTRSSMDEHVARLLKDVVLRSLSIEVVSEDAESSGSMYFGDDSRGHVISHVFSLKDSNARGFTRRYCLVVLGKNPISLLSHYDFIEENLRKTGEYLRRKSEQSKAPLKPTAALAQLVDEPHVFAQLHMRFVFLLAAQIYHLEPPRAPDI
ncbi:unnamed protein product [Phyllotreta striolata]|uniref:UDENN FLCN/SMCR8-type domain-containing protein n=1 Tax=Phyllotreta striolata TaxID=444603 RepID=A0A9N9TNR9_PHYSR|nr:unnamed protein product [Phyllotreta striolata]